MCRRSPGCARRGRSLRPRRAQAAAAIAKEVDRSRGRGSDSEARRRAARRHRDARSESGSRSRSRSSTAFGHHHAVSRRRSADRRRRSPACSGRWAGDCSTRSGRKARASSARIPARTKRFACGTWLRRSTCRPSSKWMPWHVDRSVQLFPRDPEILFFAGLRARVVQRTAGSEHAAVNDPGSRSVQPDWLGERRAAQRRAAVSRVARARPRASRGPDPVGSCPRPAGTPSGRDRRTAARDDGDEESAAAVLRQHVSRSRGGRPGPG